jgi:hypothetical protein
MRSGRGSVLVLPFLAAAVLAVAVVLAVGRAALHAVTGGAQVAHVRVDVDITAARGGNHVREVLTGRALTPAVLPQDLVRVDDGLVRGQSESTTGQQLVPTGLETQLAADARSAVVEYDVPGDVLYPLPLGPRVAADVLRVTVHGAAVASCLVQYGSQNGRPQLRACRPSPDPVLTLDAGENGLERVRLRLR